LRLRIFTVIPIAIVLGASNGYLAQHGISGTTGATTVVVVGSGLLLLAALLPVPIAALSRAAPGMRLDPADRAPSKNRSIPMNPLRPPTGP
jgi:hypothetical protein